MSKEPVGSVAEEAAKLFAVLQQAARHDHEPPAAEEVADEPVAEEHDHGTARSGGPECQWCPVCQLIAKVRTTSPETVEQLSTAAAGVLGSVRSLLEAAAEAARQAREDAESRTAKAQEPERPARPRVDRIDVSEDPEPWD
ncbi:hypothetical protein [Kribbella sp. CA-293567]|uniref:hypothetical protein n=1 Tax=Kribbella sp. CA-293567 TaxID=3002436 RepID=UPI0022DE0D8A|nr:hypothetical protein [Kribbella sp. CA-293567]WBQ02658.1 hypothetical protein OX958_22035 [Kribbella sp. CA-293567]